MRTKVCGMEGMRVRGAQALQRESCIQFPKEGK
jgi:hypothetical protein